MVTLYPIKDNKKAWNKSIPCLSSIVYASVMAGVVLATSSSIVMAQSNDIMNRLNRMENEIQTLNRAVYRGEIPDNNTPFSGGMPSSADGGMNPSQAANMEVRLQSLEQELRDLTGRVEEQGFKIREMDMRIQAIENAPKPQPYQTIDDAPARPMQSRSSNLEYVAPNEAPDNYNPDQGQDTYVNGAPVQPQVLQEQTTIQPGMDPAAMYEMSYTTLRNGDFDTAEKSFQSFIEQYPDHTLAPNATYWLGETYYVRNMYKEAARVFAQSYQKYPNGSKSPDSLLKLALSLKAMGNKNEACLALGQLLSEFPGGTSSVMARAEQERNTLSCGS